LLDELVQRPERLRDRRHSVGRVVVVEVDVIGLKAPERALERVPDVVRGATGSAVDRAASELGRERDQSASPAQRLAEEALARAGALSVALGSVEEVDAGLKSGVDDRSRPGEIDPPAEVVAAEADPRDGEIAVAELAHLHASTVSDRRSPNSLLP